MSCELTTYTTNVTDCCYLQILCNGTVIREFNLAELRVVDKGDSFTIRDRVGSMDFSNATIDVTAEDVRTLRCSCAGAAASGCTSFTLAIACKTANTFNDNNPFEFFDADDTDKEECKIWQVAFLNGIATYIYSGGQLLYVQFANWATVSCGLYG